IYDLGNNAMLSGNSLGQIGTDWAFVTLGGFFGTDTTDMLLRSSTTGGFEIYDIANNNITNAAFLGTVGLNWQFSGVGNFSGLGESDCSCAIPIPADWRPTTSTTIRSPTPPSWARSA